MEEIAEAPLKPKMLLSLRGFQVARPATASTSTVWYTNPTINDIYTELVRDPSKVEDWEFQQRALAVCMALYRGTPTFLAAQVTCTDQVYRRAVDFTVSTINFLRTGRRAVSVELWNDLLVAMPDKLEMLTRDELINNRNNYNDIIYQLPEKLVAQWCSQRGGFRDLVISTALFFGDRFVK